MNCPKPIADLVLAILTHCLLSTRAAGWGGKAAQCAIQADHVHNLPSLLADYRPELLDYYWKVQRACYIKKCMEAGVSIASLEPIWQELSKYLPDQPPAK
jgi:hypothetical protein